MLDLYKRKFCKIITYGCGAWFNFTKDKAFPRSWCLNKALIKELENIQNYCLRLNISGVSYHTVAYQQLLNELHLQTLEVLLYGEALLQRMGQLWKDPFEGEVNAVTERRRVRKDVFRLTDAACVRHPAVVQEEEAKRYLSLYGNERPRGDGASLNALLRWRRKLRGCVVSKLNALYSKPGWEEYSEKNQSKYPNPALSTEWSDRNLNRYKRLMKAESTFLLLWRTNKLPLNARLFYTHPAEVKTQTCPLCKKDKHHAEHLFIHCEYLKEARSELREHMLCLDYTLLLSDQRYIKKAVQWGIMHFQMPMFAEARKALLAHKASATKQPRSSKLAYSAPTRTSGPDFLSSHSRPHRTRRTRRGLPREGAGGQHSNTT